VDSPRAKRGGVFLLIPEIRRGVILYLRDVVLS